METNGSSVAQKPPHAAALIMAASRRGVDDPVAKIQNKAHKCLVELDGQVMLERVLESMVDSGCFKQIHVSADTPDVLHATEKMRGWVDAGTVVFVQARGNLADSVIGAVEEMESPLPLIIATGDNALQTPEIVRDFVEQFHASNADVMVGITSEEVVLREFSDSGLAFHRLKDRGFSSCNLYAVRNDKAMKTVKIFEGGGQFGKKHIRILKAFGVMPFIVYKLKLSTVAWLMKAVGRNLGVSLEAAWLDYPYGPIDVDNRHSFDITEAALKRRRGAA